MNFTLRRKNFYILIFSLTSLLIIFTFYNSLNTPSLNTLRNLIGEDKYYKRCKKTSKKYKEKNIVNSIDIEITDNSTTLTEYQKILKEIIQEKDYKKIEKYLHRIIIYLIIAIIDVIFIIFWITFCCCVCKKVGKQNKISSCAKCSFIIFFVLSFIVIILCIIGLISFPKLNQSINDVVCSTYKLVFHFLYGFNDNNINTVNNNEQIHWIGLNNISHTIASISKENINSHNYKDALNKVQTMINIFDAINNITLTDIEKIMKKMDDLYPFNSIIIFGFIGIFNLFGLIIMLFIFVCEFKYMNCLFNLFWNLEILFIIITFFLSAILGSFSVVSKDLSKILINQKDNILDENDVFIFNYTGINNEINICLNKDGNVSKLIFGEKLNLFYEQMMNKGYNITYINDLYDCSFYKLDYNNLIDELNDNVTKKLFFVSLLIIIIDLVGIIKILLGIVVYNNLKEYYPPPDINEINVNVNNKRVYRPDMSAENLNRQNNEVIFSRNFK